jgi:hypothetical protein
MLICWLVRVIVPLHTMKYIGREEIKLHSFLTSDLGRSKCSVPSLGHFMPKGQEFLWGVAGKNLKIQNISCTQYFPHKQDISRNVFSLYVALLLLSDFTSLMNKWLQSEKEWQKWSQFHFCLSSVVMNLKPWFVVRLTFPSVFSSLWPLTKVNSCACRFAVFFFFIIFYFNLLTYYFCSLCPQVHVWFINLWSNHLLHFHYSLVCMCIFVCVHACVCVY